MLRDVYIPSNTSTQDGLTESTFDRQAKGWEGLVEDVDMDAEPSGDTGELQQGQPWISGGHTEVIRYLAIDTNVLISHLPLVQALHELLLRSRSTDLVLLIPSVVINELDRLAASVRLAGSRIDDETTIGDRARAATSWLLIINQVRRESGHGVVRCQRWVEKLDSDLRKADDRILDCCLYFLRPPTEQVSLSVVLWTDDRNLSLLAETNDIPTVGGRYVTLYRVIKATGADLPMESFHGVHDHIAGPTSDINYQEESMELDEEHLESLASSSFTSAFASPPTTSTGSSISTSLSAAELPIFFPSTPLPSRTFVIPADILAATTLVFRHIASALTEQTASPPVDSDSPLPSLRASFDFLTGIDSDLSRDDPTSDIHKTVLRAMSATRTIIKFVEARDGVRRPRSGEVGDALEVLAAVFVETGLVGGVSDDLSALAERMRLL